MLQRPKLHDDGSVTLIPLPVCACSDDERRGPSGGVCGACGGAIPNLQGEVKWPVDR